MSTVRERIEFNRSLSRILNLNPALKLLLVFIIETVLLSLFQISFACALVIAIVFLILFFLRKFPFLSYFIGVLAIAAFTVFRLQQVPQNTHDLVLPDLAGTFNGRIDNVLKVNDKYMRYKVTGTIDLKYTEPFYGCSAFLNVFRPGSKCKEMKPGNAIYFSGKFSVPRRPVFSTDFDEAAYAKSNEVMFLASTSSEKIACLDAKRNFRGICSYASDNLCAMADRLFRPDYAPIIKALVLGDKTTMDYQTKQLFILSGTAHILAVSGLHVGIITSIILLLSGFVKSKHNQRLIKFFILASALFAYSALTGFSASVCRAAFAAVMTYLVYLADRNPEPINILSFCVFLLMVIFPPFITSLSFQMSVCSVFGILLLYNLFYKNIGFLLRQSKINSDFLAASLAMTFSSSIIISPVIAGNFPYFSLFSPIANLFVIPLMSLAMVSAVIVFPLGFICFPAAHFLANTTDLLIMLSTEINRFIISLPFAYFSGNSILPIAIFSSLFMLYLFTFKHLRQFYFRLGVIIIIAFSVWCISLSPALSKHYTANIYPLKDLAVAEIPLDSGRIFYYAADRKNRQAPHADYKFANYLKSKSDNGSKIILGLTGNAGLATFDMLKADYHNQIKPISLNFDDQKKIEALLGLHRRLPQIIEKIKI